MNPRSQEKLDFESAPKKSIDITQNKHGGNEESILAFEKNKGSRDNQRREIFDIVALMGAYGVTTDEIVHGFDYAIQTVSARMSELKRDGMIVKIGRRKTRSGSTAGVFVVAEAK